MSDDLDDIYNQARPAQPAPVPDDLDDIYSQAKQQTGQELTSPQKAKSESSLSTTEKFMGGFQNVMNHIDPFRYVSVPGILDADKVKSNQDALQDKLKADGPSIARSAGEMTASLPLLMGGQSAIAEIPTVGSFLAGTGGTNLLAKGASAAIGGLGTTAGFNALTGTPQTPENLAIGAALGPVARGAGALIGGSEAEEALNSQDMKAISSAKFQQAAEKGGQYSGDFADKLLNLVNSQKATSKWGAALNTDSPVNTIAARLEPFKGQAVDLESLKNFDEYLGDQINKEVRANGTYTADANKMLEIQQTARDMAMNPGEGDLMAGSSSEGANALKEARKTWAGYLKMRDLENIQYRAENAINPDTVLKNGYRALINNSKKSRFYSDDETALLEKAAKTGIGQDITNLIGSRLTTLVAGAVGGTPGAVLGYGAGAVARNASMGARTARGQAVVNQVAKNALAGQRNPLLGNSNSLPLSAYVNRLLGVAVPPIGSEQLSNP